MKNTIVYIDGFNFFHSAILDKIRAETKSYPPCCYPNLMRLCENKLSTAGYTNHKLYGVRYFTALVSDAHTAPRSERRQFLYNRELCNSGVKICQGQMRYWWNKKQQKSQQKEKQTDVNLATYFVHDACKNYYDHAVLVSNDSDYRGMINFVKKALNKTVDVWVFRNVAKDLQPVVGDNWFRITNADLKNAGQIANDDYCRARCRRVCAEKSLLRKLITD